MEGKLVEFTYHNGSTVTTLGVATTSSLGVATLDGINLPGLNAGDYAGSVVASFAQQTDLAAGIGYTASTGAGDLDGAEGFTDRHGQRCD